MLNPPMAVGAALLLLLVALTSSCPTMLQKLTPEAISTMQRGVYYGNRLADNLHKNRPFSTFTAQADTFVIPHLTAIQIIFEVIGEVCKGNDDDDKIKEEKRKFMEIKKSFNQITGKLDGVVSELKQIKEIIEWRDMQVKFESIEYRIRLMDDRLNNVMTAPKEAVKDSRTQFVRIYEQEYKEAGFALYDAVAFNDHVFAKNLLTAVRKYSKGNRRMTQQFSKSLYGLLMKAAAVEIAYEKFSGKKLNHGGMWIQRLASSNKAMQGADTKVMADWSNYYKGDVEDMAARYKNNKNHKSFATALWRELRHKYYWRFWLVASMDSTDDKFKQASRLASHAERRYQRHGRTFYVVSTNPSDAFSPSTARGKVPSRCHCTSGPCEWESAEWAMKCTSSYGQARFALRLSEMSWYVIGHGGRTAQSKTTVYNWFREYGTFKVFYFG